MMDLAASEQLRKIRGAKRASLRDFGISLLLFVILVGGWEAIVRIFDISPLLIAAPSAIAADLAENLLSARFYYHVGVTLWEILAGFMIGSIFGLALGITIGQWKIFEKTIYPYVIAFQTVPKVAIAPMFIVWFGYGLASKIVISATIVFFPVVVNCLAGMYAASPQQIEMLRSFTATPWQIFRMIKLQSALPYIFAGLDIGIVLSVIGAIVGEFIGSQAGLGNLLLKKNFMMDTAGTFSILIVLSVVGIVLHQIIGALRRRVVFWAEPQEPLANHTT